MIEKDSEESKGKLIAIKISKLMVYAFWTFIVYLFACACHAVGENQHSFWVGLFGWWLFTIPISLWILSAWEEDRKKAKELEIKKLEELTNYFRNKLSNEKDEREIKELKGVIKYLKDEIKWKKLEK